ncbi:hypothetical protein JCM6882_003554 [Rhodosporidiobolus microsporus]
MSAIPPSLDYNIAPPTPTAYSSHGGHPSHSPAASPAGSAAHGGKRKAAELGENGEGKRGKGKGKGKAKEVDEDDEASGDEGGGGEGRKRKRNRMALSCKECKRRKIKCDRVMPVCGHCSKRNRPTDCTWDVFQPANDAFLPPTLARTAEVEQLAVRLAHVEKYLATLPPNFALFRPLPLEAMGLLGEGRNGGLAALSAAAEGAGLGEARRIKEDEGYSDTEDAAVTLENGVFNGRLGDLAATPAPSTSSKPFANPTLPSTSTSQCLAAPATSSSRAAAPTSAPALPPPLAPNHLQHTRFGAPTHELTPALTSIFSSSPPPSSAVKAALSIDFDAGPEEVHKARRAEVERIVKALPGKEATVWLVERYFGSVAWLFNHLHAPSFRAELAFFHAHILPTRAHEVDLFYLALLLMVLCLALDSTYYKRSPLALEAAADDEDDPLKEYSAEERKLLPERWFAASMRALRLAEWETVPRVRTIQTIVLFTQYLQLSSASRGQPSQLAMWLSGAIRLAQVLGLHLLGSNPETMPPEDPAWPPGRNSLKREMAKRLWAVLVYQDWLGANSRTRSYSISPLHFDTDDPSNVNDADLSPSTSSIHPAPSSVLTDSSASRVRIAMARQVRLVFDRIVLTRDFVSHDTVLELDAGFRSILDELPERWTLAEDETEREMPMRRFQRHFVLEGLHNRIFRLHRPLLSRAGKNPKYKFSAEACLKSARAVVVSTHNIREAVADIPYTYSHVLGAALVLFNDLFQAIDHDLSAPEIDSKLSTLSLALEIFSSSPTSPALGSVVQQGHRILSGLFREEERRRTARAARALVLASNGGAEGAPTGEEEEDETFAEVLQRIARSLNSDSAPHRGTPPPTRNIPSRVPGTKAPGGGPAAAAPNPSSSSNPVDNFDTADAAQASSALSALPASAFPSLTGPSTFTSALPGGLDPSASTAESVYPFPPPQAPLFDFAPYGFGSSGGLAPGSTGGAASGAGAMQFSPAGTTSGLFDALYGSTGSGGAPFAGGGGIGGLPGFGGGGVGGGMGGLGATLGGFMDDSTQDPLDLGFDSFAMQYWGEMDGGASRALNATPGAAPAAVPVATVSSAASYAAPVAAPVPAPVQDIAAMSAAEFWGTGASGGAGL